MTYSDFEAESDAQYASDVPPPSTRTDEELNLSVLKRYNPHILSIYHISPYAVVYTFSPENSAWEKCGIEGSSFLVQLSPTATYRERYAVMVLNRRGLENFSVELTSSEEVEVADEYIILQGQRGGMATVYGLWIFEEAEPASTAHQREKMARKIMECAERVEAGRHSPNAEDTGYEGEEEGEGSVELDGEPPMQGSERGRGDLASMLEQQRAADDSWSVRNHSPQRRSSQSQQRRFATSADTDFFLSAKPTSKATSPAVSAQSVQAPDPQKNILLDLFRKAGVGYNSSNP